MLLHSEGLYHLHRLYCITVRVKSGRMSHNMNMARMEK